MKSDNKMTKQLEKGSSIAMIAMRAEQTVDAPASLQFRPACFGRVCNAVYYCSHRHPKQHLSPAALTATVAAAAIIKWCCQLIITHDHSAHIDKNTNTHTIL